jgi:hypothetical protein
VGIPWFSTTSKIYDIRFAIYAAAGGSGKKISDLRLEISKERDGRRECKMLKDKLKLELQLNP